MIKPKVKPMQLLNNKIIKTVLTYLLLLLAAASMHFYFTGSDTYFNENCCDSFKQVTHFYPYLQHEFSEGNFFWSWSNGLGGDLLGGFSYYYSTSPLFWLTMLFPAMETLREIFEGRLYISIGKLFLSMVFMFHLLRYMKLLRVSSIIGALIYGGSVFFMFNSLRYDFMIDGMVYLPILILAFEYALDRKKPFVFIAAVFVIVCANFYLAFINSLFLGMYAILKYTLYERKSLKGFGKYMLRFIGSYFAGLLLAAFAFLPAVYAFLKVDRFYYDAAIPLLFGSDFYKELFYRLFFMSGASFDFVVTFPVVVLLLVPLGLLLTDKANKKRFLFALLFSVLVLIPFSYSLFNGLSAMQYRWLYLFIFVMAWITAFILDDLLKGKMKARPLWAAGGMLLLLAAALAVKEKIIGAAVTERDMAVLVIAVISAILLALLIKKAAARSGPLIAVLLIAVIWVNAAYMNTEMLQSFLKDPAALKQQHENILNNYGTEEQQKMISDIQQRDDEFYRIMWNALREPNAPMLYDYHGFSAYTSLMAGNIHEFMKKDYNILHWNSPSLYQNLDNRLYLETALANKYYIRPHDIAFEPHGYSLIASNDSYEVYENDYALPIGFLYEEVVPRSEFEELNFAERDQLMLQAAVVEEEEGEGLPRYDTEKLTVEERHFDVSELAMTNASLTKEGLIVAEEGASFTMENPWTNESGEIMLELAIKETSKRPFEVYSAFKVFADIGEGAIYNYPREKIVINAGHQFNKAEYTFVLDPGTYEISDVALTFNPYDSYPEMAKSRLDQSLQNVSYTGRSVQGEIQADQKSLLFMSVPYSPGWKVKVDGKKSEIVEINSAFIGIPLSQGDHKIEITYTTPFFKAGLLISLITLAVLLIILVFGKKELKKAVDCIFFN
jgi:uncharacterized membrane protein YfhO